MGAIERKQALGHHLSSTREIAEGIKEATRGAAKWVDRHKKITIPGGITLAVVVATIGVYDFIINPAGSSNIGEPSKPGAARPKSPTDESGYHLLENGAVTTWTTEQGEKKPVPAIEGAIPMQFIPDITASAEIVYFAMQNNPYNLREGTTIGSIRPNVNLITEMGKPEQVGGIVINPKVLPFLLAQAGPEVTGAIPIDPTSASPAVDQETSIQILKDSSGKEYAYVTVPSGSQVIQTNTPTEIAKSFEGFAFNFKDQKIKHGGKFPKEYTPGRLGDPFFGVSPDSSLPLSFKHYFPEINGNPQFEISSSRSKSIGLLTIEGMYVFVAGN